MRAILSEAAEGDFILLVDDDDPPPNQRVIEHLTALAARLEGSESRLGAVALTGAQFDRSRGRIRRVLDHELAGTLEADYFAGNTYPMYAIKAIKDVGIRHQERPVRWWGLRPARGSTT
jgi:hypothetical protein